MGCSASKISVLQDTNLEKYIVKENTFLDYFLYYPFDLDRFLSFDILKKRICIDGNEKYTYTEIGFFDLEVIDKILVTGNFVYTLFILFGIVYGYFLGIKYIKNIYKKSKLFLILYIFTLVFSVLFLMILFYLFLAFHSF